MTNPAVEDFLGRFFADPNRLRQESRPGIDAWVERLRRDDPRPTVLPCFRGGTTVDWYGLAFDDRQLTALGEGLTAFVGPTYSTFRGEVARLDPADPIDAAVRSLTGGRAFKFRGENPKDIWRVLDRMRRVWERRGTRALAPPRPVGRALRDFDTAIRGRDEGVARASLLLLREGGHIDDLNHLYLQVQLLSAFHRWSEITGHPHLPDLLRLRRPRSPRPSSGPCTTFIWPGSRIPPTRAGRPTRSGPRCCRGLRPCSSPEPGCGPGKWSSRSCCSRSPPFLRISRSETTFPVSAGWTRATPST